MLKSPEPVGIASTDILESLVGEGLEKPTLCTYNYVPRPTEGVIGRTH